MSILASYIRIVDFQIKLLIFFNFSSNLAFVKFTRQILLDPLPNHAQIINRRLRFYDFATSHRVNQLLIDKIYKVCKILFILYQICHF